MDSLGAVNIAMPFVMIATAFNMLTSIGGVTVCAIHLGREDKEGANNVFLHSLTLNFLIAAMITILGMVFTEPLCAMLGADAFYMPMVKEYVFWWALFAIPSALSVNFQCFCRNDGSPMLVMVATIISTVLNIFLDWLFIFPMEMGIMGAALATGISQTVAWLIVLMHFIQKKGDLRIKAYKPDGSLYGKVLSRGLPEMIAQFATPVTTIVWTELWSKRRKRFKILFEKRYGYLLCRKYFMCTYFCSICPPNRHIVRCGRGST